MSFYSLTDASGSSSGSSGGAAPAFFPSAAPGKTAEETWNRNLALAQDVIDQPAMKDVLIRSEDAIGNSISLDKGRKADLPGAYKVAMARYMGLHTSKGVRPDDAAIAIVAVGGKWNLEGPQLDVARGVKITVPIKGASHTDTVLALFGFGQQNGVIRTKGQKIVPADEPTVAKLQLLTREVAKDIMLKRGQKNPSLEDHPWHNLGVNRRLPYYSRWIMFHTCEDWGSHNDGFKYEWLNAIALLDTAAAKSRGIKNSNPGRGKSMLGRVMQNLGVSVDLMPEMSAEARMRAVLLAVGAAGKSFANLRPQVVYSPIDPVPMTTTDVEPTMSAVMHEIILAQATRAYTKAGGSATFFRSTPTVVGTLTEEQAKIKAALEGAKSEGVVSKDDEDIAASVGLRLKEVIGAKKE